MESVNEHVQADPEASFDQEPADRKSTTRSTYQHVKAWRSKNLERVKEWNRQAQRRYRERHKPQLRVYWRDRKRARKAESEDV